MARAMRCAFSRNCIWACGCSRQTGDTRTPDRVPCVGFSKAILWEACSPQNAEAVKGVFPTMDGSPFSGLISRRQIHDLQDGPLAKKRDARPDRVPQALVERFYGVGRVDDFAYLRGKLEKGDDIRPIPPPQCTDRWVPLIPLL